MTVDQRWMDLALSLGRRGAGRTWPNPAVGCVIVQKNRVVGRGWTQPGGRPHAETIALGQAGADAKGATAYVTLEPCAHTGQTPPCCEALIAAGISRVVAAIRDPDPRVSGRGMAKLEKAGIAVEEGLGAGRALRDHAGFLTAQKLGRPYLTLKLASSFDGRIATASGESQWITGGAARRVVHAMRARHDAILVGAGTARADLPSLTVRGLGDWNAPVRVVLSAALDIPQTGPLADNTDDAPVWLLHGAAAPKSAKDFWIARGAVLIEVERGADGLTSAMDALQKLGDAGITRVFCEGGAGLAASLLKNDLVDELVGFTAGLVLGADAMAGFGGGVTERLSDAKRFRLSKVQSIENDILHIWHRASPLI